MAVEFRLHKKQSLAYTTRATEILYGGAAGGGKSHLMRVRAITFCLECPGGQVYLFRRLRDDLIKNHMEGPHGFRNLLAPYVKQKLVTIVEDEIRFKNGSKIYLCHCKDEKDRYKYQGAEIHLLLIDELTHFSEKVYRYLRNRVRMIGLKHPGFPRIICSANPGGQGHTWVKAMFIDNCRPYEIVHQKPDEGGLKRQFIPARLEDNPSMEEDDPTYEDRLAGLGSEALVKAYRWGDWNIVEGAFFPEFDSRRHIIQPFEVPEEWARIRAMDWGSAAPFSVGWYAVASDDFSTGDSILLPRGCLIKYREWYGASKPNIGLKLTAEEAAEGIKQREKGDPKISRAVLDPSAFSVDGGPSIAERMANCGVQFGRADNRRIAKKGAMSGWDQLRARLKGDADGNPMIVFFDTCKDTIRTLPSMQHDELNPEDMDTNGEDHCFAPGTLVATEYGPKPIESLTENDRVWSRGKWREARNPRLTKRLAEVVRLTFDNGVQIVCTPDHRFLDHADEWCYAKDLKGREVKCDQSYMAKQSKSSTGYDITVVETISRGVKRDFTASYGNFIMAPCPTATMSITRTITSPITTPKTLSAYPSESIYRENTANNLSKTPYAGCQKRKRQQQNGMGRQKAESGTRSTTKNICAIEWLSGCLNIVGNAARGIMPPKRTPTCQNTAETTAKPVRCVSVEEWGVSDVYCLTQPETEMFTLEGGFVVHNCADETRYACMARPYIKPLIKPDKPWEYTPPTFNEAVLRAERNIRRREAD